MSFEKIINSFNKKIVLWGDLILDEYVKTQSVRVSREAPVLITEFESKHYLPGGAGNVLLNLKKLGAEVFPISIVGDDQAGMILCQLLEQNEISREQLLILKDYKTALKSRILAGAENTRKQQILRIDYFNKGTPQKEAAELILNNLKKMLAEIDYLIISDYLGQVVDPELFTQLRKLFPEKVFLLDSRRRLLFFRQATYLTPNEAELKALFPDRIFYGDDDYYQALQELFRRSSCSGIVLKRGQQGMIVFNGSEFKKISIFGSSEIVDVTGAGDTVLAVLSLALAAGASLFEAAELANIAGGLVVMKEGAYALSRKELLEAVTKV